MNSTPARYFYLLNREKAGIIGGGYNWWGVFYTWKVASRLTMKGWGVLVSLKRIFRSVVTRSSPPSTSPTLILDCALAATTSPVAGVGVGFTRVDVRAEHCTAKYCINRQHWL